MLLYGTFEKDDALKTTGQESSQASLRVMSNGVTSEMHHDGGRSFSPALDEPKNIIAIDIESETNLLETKLLFKEVCFDIGKCQILKNVSGLARSGEILAILGPSGSGKSTLLNALSGRVTVTSGQITLDSQQVTRHLRRRISYVLQKDVFYPSLTLAEMLKFTAMLRLPASMSEKQKQRRVQEVIDILELGKCLNTKMGNASGGERRRASIACELITNPKILLLDEPTSGLDSAIASSLMATLTNYAKKLNKVVVTSIHQPSSQIFRMFTNVLLMAEGQVAYFGPNQQVVEHFSGLGLKCDPLYNPADFILEQLKADDVTVKRILDAAAALRIQKNWPPELREERLETTSKGTRLSSGPGTANLSETRWRYLTFNFPKKGEELLLAKDVSCRIPANEPKWPTGFLTQYAALTQRAFVLSRDRFLSLLNFCQILFLSLFCGALWFQTPRTEETAQDRLGMIYCLLLQQGFFFWNCALRLVFDDNDVFVRERASGIYRVSAYFLAIMTAEIPVTVVLATTYVSILYWMGGLMPEAIHFLVFWMVHILYVLQAQSFGFCIGTLIRDSTKMFTATTTLIIVFMLSGGFYNTHVHDWFLWTRYVSYISYVYSAFCEIEFTRGFPMSCSPQNTTSFPEFCINGTSIPGEAIIARSNVNICSLKASVLLIAFAIICTRTLTYIILRFFRRPKL